MNGRFVITGTDTEIGKTIFAAALTRALGASYWKPIQAGLDGETDSQCVTRLSGAPTSKILPEAFRLKIPASPHFSAAQENLTITVDQLAIPGTAGPLVIEGAGGALVPINDRLLFADLFASWGHPVIIVARTALGTISHSLMTIEALHHRGVPIHGVAFVGKEVPDSQETICRIGRAKQLGRLPMLDPLDCDTLAAAFDAQFTLSDFGASG